MRIIGIAEISEIVGIRGNGGIVWELSDLPKLARLPEIAELGGICGVLPFTISLFAPTIHLILPTLPFPISLFAPILPYNSTNIAIFDIVGVSNKSDFSYNSWPPHANLDLSIATLLLIFRTPVGQ